MPAIECCNNGPVFIESDICIDLSKDYRNQTHCIYNSTTIIPFNEIYFG